MTISKDVEYLQGNIGTEQRIEHHRMLSFNHTIWFKYVKATETIQGVNQDNLVEIPIITPPSLSYKVCAGTKIGVDTYKCGKAIDTYPTSLVLVTVSMENKIKKHVDKASHVSCTCLFTCPWSLVNISTLFRGISGKAHVHSRWTDSNSDKYS